MPELKKPIIQVWEHIDNPLERVVFFNLPYKKVFDFSPHLNESDPINLWLYKTEILDLDKNDQKELVTEFLGSPCGSGTLSMQLVLGHKDGSFGLLDSIPKADYIGECVNNKDCDPYNILNDIDSQEEYEDKFKKFSEKRLITNLKDGKKYEINISNTDDYKKFIDLDDDEQYELVFAHPHCWGINQSETDCENADCHWCEQTWLIGVYKFIDGKYYVDNKWMDSTGRLYTPEEKIDLYDAHGYPYIEGNALGFISQYYLQGSENSDDNLYPPYLIYNRGKSRIEEIVREKYNSKSTESWE